LGKKNLHLRVFTYAGTAIREAGQGQIRLVRQWFDKSSPTVSPTVSPIVSSTKAQGIVSKINSALNPGGSHNEQPPMKFTSMHQHLEERN
jgi:hypothetical protein